MKDLRSDLTLFFLSFFSFWGIEWWTPSEKNHRVAKWAGVFSPFPIISCVAGARRGIKNRLCSKTCGVDNTATKKSGEIRLFKMISLRFGKRMFVGKGDPTPKRIYEAEPEYRQLCYGLTNCSPHTYI